MEYKPKYKKKLNLVVENIEVNIYDRCLVKAFLDFFFGVITKIANEKIRDKRYIEFLLEKDIVKLIYFT